MGSVSPLTIQIAIACYVSTKPFEVVGAAIWESPATREVLAWLKVNELVDEGYRSNDKLKAWVEKICETPQPYLAWTFG